MNQLVRKANAQDLDAIKAIYDRIHTVEEQGPVTTGWQRAVYPTRATAMAALERGDIFVLEVDGEIAGSALINQIQVDVYKDAPWQYEAADEQVMVLHTLVIDPLRKGQGLGKIFVRFYEDYARKNGCPYLRMDTNALNVPARTFYKKQGYKEIAILPCTFNNIAGVQLVLLEKKLQG